ncbi:MAG: TetR/AcrR family transcriptional regulator, partial [Brevibacterium aurantiacum]|nr:TetR/AcrR family transcriptional regulator [Brevibacterium aurantiacum]
DALYHPTLAASWDRHLGPWFDIAGLDASARGLLTTARFCADGAWMSEATGVFLADDLAAVRRHALVLVDSAEAAQEKTAQEMEA